MWGWSRDEWCNKAGRVRVSQLCILLIDKDATARKRLRRLLERVGYQVYEVESCAKAVEYLLSHSVQVVLLEINRSTRPPRLSDASYALQKQVLEECTAMLNWLGNHHPQIKTLVLAEHNFEESAYQALKHGAFDFLERSVPAVPLLYAVKRAFMFYDTQRALKQREGVHKMQLDAVLGEGVKPVRNQAEEKLVRQVLMDTHFNVHETARRLALKRENIYYLIHKYGLRR